MTNESGQAVWQWAYSAFGDEEPTRATHRFAHTSEGFTTSISDVTYNPRYPGQYADRESGLHYNYFRSYDPFRAGYTQVDPIGLRGGWNQFTYVTSSPLMLADPRGLDNPSMGPYGPASNAYGQRTNAATQASQALGDFQRNYSDMRDANTINADKYFHCKANCEATRRGPTGEAAACLISDVREWADRNVKGDSESSSRADQAANAVGRSEALSSNQSCIAACAPFRPRGLPAQY